MASYRGPTSLWSKEERQEMEVKSSDLFEYIRNMKICDGYDDTSSSSD